MRTISSASSLRPGSSCSGHRRGWAHRDPGRGVLEEVAEQEGVVTDQEPAGAQVLRRPPAVLVVPLLVGVDENQIKSFVEAGNNFQSVA